MITIPYKYTPRSYQLPLLKAMDSGCNRAVCVIHRRAGKDKTALNLCIKKTQERVGLYLYLFPTYSQGRKVIWDGIDRDGFKLLDHFPKEIIDGEPNNTEMKIRLKNGSIFQVVGTEEIDRIVGTNPVGCVFSEYSLQNPKAWDLLRPILRENKGWAVFLYTPRGQNHGQELYDMASNNPEWYCSLLTVDDTKREDGTSVISKEDIEEERRSGMSEDLIQQEFYCSFGASIQGAYYSNELKKAREENRIGFVPFEKELPVFTAWDLGINDTNSIWFWQEVGLEIRIIDYYENSGEGLPHYLSILREKGYDYETHFFPHDIEVREYTNGKSRSDTLKELGLRNFKVVPKLSLDDGIEAVRRIFSRCYFDKEKTSFGVKCLQEYHKEYDDKRKCFHNRPFHNWASNGSDAFRYLALSVKSGTSMIKKHNRPKVQVKTINYLTGEPYARTNTLSR